MKLKVEDGKLSGGTSVDISITQNLINKYFEGYRHFSKEEVLEVLEGYEVDNCIEFLITELNLENRHATDDCLYTLAVLLLIVIYQAL